MPSSQTVPPTDRRYSRRLMWLAVFIFVLFGGYTIGWFVVADRLESGIDAELAKMSDPNGVTASCDDRAIVGFPFRFELNCSSVSYDSLQDNVAFQAKALRGARQVYDLQRTVAELDGPLLIEAPFALNLDWSLLHASVRDDSPLPDRVSVEAKDLRGMDAASAGIKILFQAKQLEGHMRTEGQIVDLAGRFETLQIEPEAIEGRTIPPLTGLFDLGVDNGVALAGARPRTARGANGQLRVLSLSIEGGGSVTATGPVSVSADGLIDADLKVAIVNANAVSQAMQTAVPEQANSIRTAFAALALLGDQPTLPLTVEKGEARLGFIPLGRIAPLN